MDKPQITDNTIVVPSDQDFLADVDMFIEGILRGYGTNESVIADIAISVSELVNNAMLHGNKSSPDKSVTVNIEREDNSVTISVRDQGSGFDPDSIANPIDEMNLLREVGRGIFIVRSLMDNVDIDATSHGTTIVITKSINKNA
jgi:serine/threonine-protein kinase RsbW